MLFRSLTSIFVLILVLVCPLAAEKPSWAGNGNGNGKGGGGGGGGGGTPPSDPVAAAHQFLVNQMRSTGLVDSYADSTDVCYTYDQAVATLGFLSTGDTVNARKVLNGLAARQNPDGSWYHAYYCSSSSVAATQKYVGSNAWIAVAVAHYERASGDTITFRNMARRVVEWMVPLMQSDGGINGGYGADGGLITWASTEHNEDAFSALDYFQYTSDAGDVSGFLNNAVYSTTEDRWWQGRNDPANPLDVNPLGVLALGPTGTHPYSRSLDYAMSHHRSTQTWKQKKTSISVDGFDFNADKNDVWLEGTAQMVIALRNAGDTANADHFLTQIFGIQQSDGGIPYSVNGSFNGDFTMSRKTSVAATGWALIALSGVNPLQP